MNKKSASLMFFVFVLVLTSVACYDFQEFIKSLKIEHVFSIPSKQYGPGSVLLYTAKSGYTKILFPWDVINCRKESYEKELEKETTEGNKFVQWNPTTSIQNAKETEFKIKLGNEEKLKLSAEYQNISSIKVKLNNGKIYDSLDNYDDMITNITHNLKNIKAIQERLAAHPDGIAVLVVTTYGYDIESLVKVGNSWKATAELPSDVLSVISKKIGIGLNIGLNIEREAQSELSMSGKNVFVGFNGDTLKVKRRREEIVWSLESYDKDIRKAGKMAVDITDLFR